MIATTVGIVMPCYEWFPPPSKEEFRDGHVKKLKSLQITAYYTGQRVVHGNHTEHRGRGNRLQWRKFHARKRHPPGLKCVNRILIRGEEDGKACLAEPTMAQAKMQMCMTFSGQLGTSVWSRRKDSNKEFVCGDLSLVIILIIATIY